jgi:hypothetical protein
MSDKATIEATGIASAPPDVARVRLVVFAEDPAPGTALTSCSLVTERVLSALRQAGVASSDLETASIDLSQQHRRDEQDTFSYLASNSLVATVRPPEDTGRVVAAAVDAAGTGITVHNVNFDIGDRTSVTAQARRDAVAKAISAARELADAAGVVLGPLLELAEGVRHRPQPVGPRFMAAARTVQSPPVELGELGVAVTVTAVFGVEQTAAR